MSDKIIAICTGSLLIFNFIFIVFSYKQIVFSYKQSVNTGEAVAISKKSMDLAEKNFEKSMDLAEKNFEIENRSFVIMENISNVKYNVGEKSSLDITIKNFGRTPARIKYTVAGFEITDTATFIKMMGTPEKLDSIAKTRLHHTMICPNDIFRFTDISLNELSKETDIDLGHGTVEMCVLVKIIYNDFWGKEHFTCFCGTYDRIDGTFSAFGNYNDIK